MPFPNELKAQICRYGMIPNFPLGEFISWVERVDVSQCELLWHLDLLQEELDAETEALRYSSTDGSESLTQQEYWCFYCNQVRTHFRTLTNHPLFENRLALIQTLSQNIRGNSRLDDADQPERQRRLGDVGRDKPQW